MGMGRNGNRKKRIRFSVGIDGFRYCMVLIGISRRGNDCEKFG